MAEWHHRLNAHEFEQTLEDCEGQGGLVYCMQFMQLQKVGHNLPTEQQRP